MRKRIYIAGPMTRGDRVENLSAALKAYRDLIGLGFAPMCPQLSFFAEPFCPGVSYAQWLETDLPWVACAHAVLRLPGKSLGADEETAVADALAIPVFHRLDDLLEAFSR